MVENVAAEWGKLDICFCNAGTFQDIPAEDMPLKEFKRVIEVNLTGAFITARAAGRSMIAVSYTHLDVYKRQVERFPPDEFLTEKQFIELYGVSKAPVREALIELCNEGILRSIPRLGYQIIPVTQKDITNSTELRLLIEMNAFRKMSESFNEEMLEKIRTLNKNWMEDVITGNIDVQKRWMHNLSLIHI